MNGNSILPICEEDFITDELIEAYIQEVSSSASSDTACETLTVTHSLRRVTSPLSRPPTLSSAFVSVDSKNLCKDSGQYAIAEDLSRRSPRHTRHLGSTSLGPSIEISHSDITSDDSGDFAFLTSDVHDADTYDLLRHYLLYSKQQKKRLDVLEEECAQLEEEQHRLYRASLAAGAIQGASKAPAVGTSPPACLHQPPVTGAGVAADDAFMLIADDEFGEAHINPLTTCPYAGLSDTVRKLRPYRYGQPSIAGAYTPVFKDGMLYQCTTAGGSWVFYNDSQQYVMQVKYILGASSVITAGPHGSVRQRASGEFEAAVVVWPQETEVLLVGQVNGYQSQSVAVPVDSNYENPHTAASTALARAQLDYFAQQLGKASVCMLTAEDVLQFCIGQSNDSEATVVSSGRQHFVDPEFPPGRSSLYREGSDSVFLWDMPWRLPDQYLPTAQLSETSLFAGAVLPIDPFPGEGGNTSLCSAACALAAHPARVTQLFRHPVSTNAGKRERGVGAYRVTLHHSGWWTSTVVDSYLPASLQGPDLGRCAHDLRKLWYSILEKAYAKLYGSYAAIQLGDPLEALQDLTGYPTFRFDDGWAKAVEDRTDAGNVEGASTSSPYEDLFTLLEERVHQRGYLVLLSLPDEGPADSQAEQMGMVYGMSYTVQRVVRHGSSRLLQIQCSTSKPGNCGLWCAESVRWCQDPSLARLCGMSDADKPKLASIWLDWSEALHIFEGGGVCCSRWDWVHDCRVRGFFEDGIPSIVLEVSVEDSGEDASAVEAYCILSQEDDRGMSPSNPNRDLRPLMLTFSSHRSDDEVNEGDSGALPADQCVRCVCSTDPDTPTDELGYILGRDTALHVILQPSPHPYYLVPRALGSMKNKIFTVGIVSNTPVTKAGRLRVRPVQLPDSSPIFQNRRDFSTRELRSVAAVSFQIRGPDGRVRVGCGSSIG